MKDKRKLFGIYLPIFIITTLVSVTLRTVALFTDYTVSTGYYDNKLIISIADYLVTLSCIFFFTYLFAARRDIKLIPNFTSPATYIPTTVLFVAMSFMIVSISDSYLSVKGFIKYLIRINTQSATSQIPAQRILLVLLGASFVFALLSLAHLALTALVESHSSTKRAYLGLCTTIFFSLYAAYLYFNTNLPINAPSKVLGQIAFLFFAAFFLFEARLSIGREKWRGYIAFGFIAALLGAYASIPSMIYYFATGTVSANCIYETALCFALFIFITARVLLTGDLVEDKPSAAVKALIGFATERESVIHPIPEVCEVIEIKGEELDDTNDDPLEDENQITIDDMGIEAPAEENREEEDDSETKE